MRIGVAKSAYFPSLSLTGTAGVEAATLGDLFKWSSRAFLLGPLVGTALSRVRVADSVGAAKFAALDSAMPLSIPPFENEETALLISLVLGAFADFSIPSGER
jgi:hypothetical protein